MKFSKALFEPLVDKVFTLQRTDGRPVRLRLANITSCTISPRYESFTLNFDPPEGEAALPDGSYIMEAEGFGPIPIFISPTHAGTPDPNKYYYESVFNVLIEENR
ncbi:MAG: hypothetical protein A4E64_00247 [Syntrophorhabdus sp. PtaU1.Bin058]|nr:MAG: hypothetical protein A4E64_00247 [Syntrophorhabdus sp. PtaU1.Bin058]